MLTRLPGRVNTIRPRSWKALEIVFVKLRPRFYLQSWQHGVLARNTFAGVIMVIKPDHSEHYKWGGNYDGWHLLNTASLSVIKERVPKGGVEEMHYHNKAQQLFYVLQGVATIQLGEETYRVLRGEALHVPPKTPHRLENDGEEELVFLVISQPHSHADKTVL